MEPCGELRRLVWLEQRLLCGAEAGPRKEGAQGWQVLNSRLGVGSTVWAVTLCGSCEMSGRGTGLRKTSPASLWKKEIGPPLSSHLPSARSLLH